MITAEYCNRAYVVGATLSDGHTIEAMAEDKDEIARQAAEENASGLYARACVDRRIRHTATAQRRAEQMLSK